MKKISNQDVFHALNQRARLFSKSLNTYLVEHGLYSSQWSILFCLHNFGTMTQTQIWKYLNVEAPTVTRSLARMEKNGWVTRSQGEDKRERLIELTDEAKNKFSIIKNSVTGMENDLLANLTKEEKEQLYHLLNKID